jgi:hypothetical protein
MSRERTDRHQLEHSDEMLVNVHGPDRCVGEHCTVHNRSDHPLRAWPQHWRTDRSIMERLCPHGVGHPDPDNPWPNNDSRWLHGCDGCCATMRPASAEAVAAELRYAAAVDTDPWDHTLYLRAAEVIERLIAQTGTASAAD